MEWGHPEYFSNFIVKGITYELFHCLSHNFYTNLSDDKKWISHSIIYLAIDEELVFYLNGKTEYFTSNLINTYYHPRLIQTAKNILPYWKEYTKKLNDKDIYIFYEKVSKLNVGI